MIVSPTTAQEYLQAETTPFSKTYVVSATVVVAADDVEVVVEVGVVVVVVGVVVVVVVAVVMKSPTPSWSTSRSPFASSVPYTVRIV